MAFILPKCPLSPGLAINSWRQLPPTWNAAGVSEVGLVLFCDQYEVQLQRGSQETENLGSLTRDWLDLG